MNIETSRDDLIGLINSRLPADYADLVAQGKMLFCGNQWNEEFKWNLDYLKSLSDDELIALYEKYTR